MKPEYITKIMPYDDLFRYIDESTDWINVGAPRDECFMSLTPLNYSYRQNVSYESIEMTPIVNSIMVLLNNVTNSEYDICFLNKYIDETKFLGWHSDDSPNMDKNHPIASVSFGASREIWIKAIGDKGDIPNENKFLLENNSVFIMPALFQNDFLHRIPKVGNKCEPRISLTFRKYKDIE